jgi:hypothetical protein
MRFDSPLLGTCKGKVLIKTGNKRKLFDRLRYSHRVSISFQLRKPRQRLHRPGRQRNNGDSAFGQEICAD